MNKIWNVAIYARVSTEKDSQGESVGTQVENLKRWILDKSREGNSDIYNLVNVYEDQGFSGSNFDRQAFKNMKQDIESNKVNMILTRDLSRFSRNYVLAGYYLEDYFKVNNIRFVSVLDNVDTEKEFDDIIPFKNLINEMYIKDCSKKIRSALATRMEHGSCIASKPPYGYKFEEVYEGAQKTIILVPRMDETTEVVREIFNLYLSGWGAGRIATYLNEKKVSPPSAHIKNFAKSKFGIWNNNTIISILKNYKYGGFMAQGTYKKVSYKVKKINPVDKEQWIIGGEFQGIINKDAFLKTQEVLKSRSKNNYRYRNGVIHPFSTVLMCNKCKGAMTYRTKYKGYKCVNSQMGGKRCTPHSVKEEDLINIVLEDVKEMIDKKINKEKIYKEYGDIEIDDNLSIELTNLNDKISKINTKFRKLYEDKLEGIISEYNFNNMMDYIQNEQERLLERKEQLTNIVNNPSHDNELLSKYKRELDNLLELKKIDRNFVETLVDKIIVEEIDGSKEKRIIVKYKFSNIG